MNNFLFKMSLFADRLYCLFAQEISFLLHFHLSRAHLKRCLQYRVYRENRSFFKFLLVNTARQCRGIFVQNDQTNSIISAMM